MEKRDFDEMVSYFNSQVLSMDINKKHKQEILGMMLAIQMTVHDFGISKWIPVTEELPDTNNDVLLQFKSNMAVGYYEDDGWSIATGEDLYSGVDESEDKPIAWMPLPELWRGE